MAFLDGKAKTGYTQSKTLGREQDLHEDKYPVNTPLNMNAQHSHTQTVQDVVPCILSRGCRAKCTLGWVHTEVSVVKFRCAKHLEKSNFFH